MSTRVLYNLPQSVFTFKSIPLLYNVSDDMDVSMIKRAIKENCKKHLNHNLSGQHQPRNLVTAVEGFYAAMPYLFLVDHARTMYITKQLMMRTHSKSRSISKARISGRGDDEHFSSDGAEDDFNLPNDPVAHSTRGRKASGVIMRRSSPPVEFLPASTLRHNAAPAPAGLLPSPSSLDVTAQTLSRVSGDEHRSAPSFAPVVQPPSQKAPTSASAAGPMTRRPSHNQYYKHFLASCRPPLPKLEFGFIGRRCRTYADLKGLASWTSAARKAQLQAMFCESPLTLWELDVLENEFQTHAW